MKIESDQKFVVDDQRPSPLVALELERARDFFRIAAQHEPELEAARIAIVRTKIEPRHDFGDATEIGVIAEKIVDELEVARLRDLLEIAANSCVRRLGRLVIEQIEARRVTLTGI